MNNTGNPATITAATNTPDPQMCTELVASAKHRNHIVAHTDIISGDLPA